MTRSVPLTSPARTLADLAPMLTAAQLDSTLGEADRRGLLDVEAVEQALRRTKGRHGQGHRRLRAALDAYQRTGAVLLRSALEERFLDLVIAAGLPRPRPNAPAGGYEVDALWPDHDVVVELDGCKPQRPNSGRARPGEDEPRLQLHGFTVLRFLHADVVQQPAEVAVAISAALAASRT